MSQVRSLAVPLIAGALAVATIAGSASAQEPGEQTRREFVVRDHSEALRKMTALPLIERFHSLWGTNSEGLFSNRWFGIETIQNPLDVWITQEILWEVKPDFVVETGSFRGGSAALWATLLEQINPDARVITIDIKDWATNAKQLPIVQRKVEFLVGSSTDPAIVAQVRERVAGSKVLVILDSLHTRDHVRDELKVYAPMVDVGSYVIVQDTGMVVPPSDDTGPYRAVEEFVAADDRFEVDLSRQRLVLTNNVGGYLKRVR